MAEDKTAVTHTVTIPTAEADDAPAVSDVSDLSEAPDAAAEAEAAEANAALLHHSHEEPVEKEEWDDVDLAEAPDCAMGQDAGGQYVIVNGVRHNTTIPREWQRAWREAHA